MTLLKAKTPGSSAVPSRGMVIRAHSKTALPSKNNINLIEPLSARELEVLQLIAQGASNRAIADRLVITVGTVKSHINHIFGKLDAHSRTEALAKARDLDLLDL